MKVYIVMWFSAELYSDYEGVRKVFDSREKAAQYLAEKGAGPHGVNEEEHDYGYYLSKTILEFTVE